MSPRAAGSLAGVSPLQAQARSPAPGHWPPAATSGSFLTHVKEDKESPRPRLGRPRATRKPRVGSRGDGRTGWKGPSPLRGVRAARARPSLALPDAIPSTLRASQGSEARDRVTQGPAAHRGSGGPSQDHAHAHSLLQPSPSRSWDSAPDQGGDGVGQNMLLTSARLSAFERTARPSNRTGPSTACQPTHDAERLLWPPLCT